MKKTITLLALFISIVSVAQTTIEKKISSVEFGRDRTIKIHLPQGYETDTIHKYPLTIVLDNDFLFNLFVGNETLFATADLAPKQIVVGLDVDPRVNQDVSTVSLNGGLTSNGKKFYNYIKKELIPYLEANLKTSPFLTLAGQGKAGNFVTHFLKEEKPIFNSYIAISPTFNTNTPALFASYNLKRLDAIDNEFFLYVSNDNAYTLDEQKIFTLLANSIEALQTEKLHVKFDNFEKSSNIPTAISAAVPNSFTLAFDLYSAISKEEFEEKVKELPPLEAIAYLEAKYLDIEYVYGTNLNVRLQDFYVIEGIVTDRMDGDYLRVLGDFALIKHPNSPLGDFYIGKFHELGKDYEKADFYYKAGYGKMDPSDPNADLFYQNIDRIGKLMKEQPKDDPLPLDDEFDDQEDNEEDDDQDNDDDNDDND